MIDAQLQEALLAQARVVGGRGGLFLDPVSVVTQVIAETPEAAAINWRDLDDEQLRAINNAVLEAGDSNW